MKKLTALLTAVAAACTIAAGCSSGGTGSSGPVPRVRTISELDIARLNGAVQAENGPIDD